MKNRNRPTPRPPRDLRGGGDRYEVLLDVLEHEAAQAARSREFEERERQRRMRQSAVPGSVVVVLALLTAWLWLFPPGFLRRDPPPPQPIEQEEATLRFTMYVQVQRIRAFEQDRGRLPLTLEEAGPPLPGMEYIRLAGALYQLTGATERVKLTYGSDLPLDEFVGSGADVVPVRRFP